MTLTLLAVVFTFASPADWAVPEVDAGLAAFEAEWGYVSREPADSWEGAGLDGGAAACGAEKALRLDIREERFGDAGSELILRMQPEAPSGLTIRSLEVMDDGRARLTAQLFGQEEVLERAGDALTIVRGSTRLYFTRC